MGMRLPLLALALTIAACGGEPQQEAAATGGGATTAPAVPASSSAAPDAQVANSIPARFLGVWDSENGTCDPASDQRLEIAANTIGFYESLGALRSVTGGESGPVTLALAMEGEGDTWDSVIKLELTGSGDGERLLLLPDPEGDVLLRPLRLKRCPS